MTTEQVDSKPLTNKVEATFAIAEIGERIALSVQELGILDGDETDMETTAYTGFIAGIYAAFRHPEWAHGLLSLMGTGPDKGAAADFWPKRFPIERGQS